MGGVIMKKYDFQCMRFVPGYNDWDQDSTLIEASDFEEAFNKFKSLGWIYKGVDAFEINDGGSEEPVFKSPRGF